MKLHHKEWPGVALLKTQTKGAPPALEEIFTSRSGTWRQWNDQTAIDRLYLFRSKSRYFQFAGSDNNFSSYFEDVVHPRFSSRSTESIEYPVYCLERRTSQRTVLLISAPYAGLLTELVTKLIRPKINNSFVFLRPLITKIYEMARELQDQPAPKRAEDALSPERTSLILRGGRITLKVGETDTDTPSDASIRSLVLVGTNILRSELFSKLVDDGIYGLRFSFDPSLAKVAFKRGNSLGVVVKMDQFGNFHYRPGFGGKNLDAVGDLLLHCMRGAAVDTSMTVPLDRSIETGI